MVFFSGWFSDVFLLSFLTRFNENIVTDPGHVDIFPASRIPKQLHHLAKPIYRPSPFAPKASIGLDSNLKEKGLRLTTEPSALCSILQLTSDNEVPSILNFIHLHVHYSYCHPLVGRFIILP